MTITDAMVEAARQAYLDKWKENNACASSELLRAALEAACGEIMRENEALRAVCESHTQLAQNLDDQNNSLRAENQKLWTKVRTYQDAERETRLTEKLAW